MEIRERIEWKRSDTLILVGMLLWAAVLFAILPYDRVFYRGDMSQFTAMEYAIRAAIKQGQWPLWNPYFMEPLMANPQSMALYPPHLLLRFLPMRWFFPVQAVLHIWLAGAALYLLLRHWGFSRTACLAGSSAVAFSVMVFVRVLHAHFSVVPCFGWPVLILLFYARLLHYGRFRDLLLTIGMILLLFLSGHTQISLTGLLLPGSYLVYYLIQERRWKSTWLALQRTTLIGLFSFGILAVQLLPTIEYFPETTRVFGFKFLNAATYFSLNHVDIFNVLVPFQLIEVSESVRETQEIVYYTTVMLPGLGLVATRFSSKAHQPLVRYVSVVAFVLIVLALGSSTPLYRIIYRLVTIFRAPGRFLLLWTLPAAVLIALGIDALMQPDRIKEKQVTLIYGLVVPLPIIITHLDLDTFLYGTSLAGQMAVIITAAMIILGIGLVVIRPGFSRQTWPHILATFMIIDASIHAGYLAFWPPYEALYPGYLKLDRAYECLGKQVDLTDGMLYSGTVWDVRPAAAHGIRVYHPYSANMRYVRELFEAGPVGHYLLRASYIALLGDVTPTETQEPFDTTCDIVVYKEKDIPPHVYAVNQLIVVNDEDREASLQMIQSASFDPSETAVISLPEGSPMPELPSEEGFQYEAAIIDYKSGKIVIDVTASQPALVVVSEVYYPGWVAVIDGDKVPVYRANHGLQGVLIEEGESHITISYKPASVRIGLIVSIVSLIGLVPAGFLWDRKTRANSDSRAAPTDFNHQ